MAWCSTCGETWNIVANKCSWNLCDRAEAIYSPELARIATLRHKTGGAPPARASVTGPTRRPTVSSGRPVLLEPLPSRLSSEATVLLQMRDLDAVARQRARLHSELSVAVTNRQARIERAADEARRRALEEAARRRAEEEAARLRAQEEADRLRLEADFLRRLEHLAEKSGTASSGPAWGVTDIDSLSNIQVVAIATTGQWRLRSTSVRLDWKSGAKKEALSDAKTAKKTCEEAIGPHDSGSGSSGSPAPSSSSGPEFLHDLLTSCFSDFTIAKSEFVSLATDLLGATCISVVTSTLPFLSTISGAFKAASAGKKALDLQRARAGAMTASVSVRPGTPEIASFAYIRDLEYYRNSKLATMATEAAAAVASVFDLGVGSGPAKTLATLAISVHRLYRAYNEKRSFTSLVASDPYGALRDSGTVGAFVMYNYPIVGLIDPGRSGSMSTDDPVIRKFCGLITSTTDSPAKIFIKQIRTAAKLVLDQSPLKIEIV